MSAYFPDFFYLITNKVISFILVQLNLHLVRGLTKALVCLADSFSGLQFSLVWQH